MDLARLRRRLLHTERLAREGATDGERAAARAAAERLRARIGLSTPPPEEDAAAWDEPLTDEVAPQDLPSRATLGAWLDDWAAGRAGAADIAARAARFVDGAVLPHLPPEDPDGVVVEVLLVLAGAQGAWAPSDLAAVHAFLGTPPSATRAGWLYFGAVRQMPWPRRMFFVRCEAAARKTSGAEEWEYSSRKWCSTSQAQSKPRRSASSTWVRASWTRLYSLSSVQGRGSWCS